MTGIYSIRCIVTNERYIGQSVSIKRRWRTHQRELEQGVHYNTHLQRAYNKYGPESFVFEILELCEKSKLNEREKFYIKLLDTHNHGFNQDDGGCDISGESNPMFGLSGNKSPRFKGNILQLSLNGEILNSFESACLAAKSVDGLPGSILKCLYTWQGKESQNPRMFSYKGYQWIYEQDYNLLLPYHDFSQKKEKHHTYITTKDINEGTLNGDVH